MIDWSDPRIATEQRELQDERTTAAIESRTNRYEWRTVVEVSDPATVGAFGTAILRHPGGFLSSWLWDGLRPLVGATALVEIPKPSGTRRIVAVAREAAPGGVSADLLATLATVEALTDEADQMAANLKAHADGLSHLHGFVTPNTLTLYDGYWSMIGQGIINERYGQVTGHVRLSGNGSTGTTWTRGEYRFRVRQQAAFGSQPAAAGELVNGADIVAADLVIVVTSAAGPTTFEVYVRLTREHEWLVFTPMWTDPRPEDTVSFEWIGCQDFVAALPAGTQYVAT